MTRLFPIILFLVVLCITSAFTQNLVPNPSFEEHSDCPTIYHDLGAWQLNMIELATPWINAKRRPYYFHPCAYVDGLRPPDFGSNARFFGHKHARTGEAMMGLHVSDNKDYAIVALTQELIEGKTYYVEYYVSPHYRQNQGSIDFGDRFCYTDAIGAYFSKESTKISGNVYDINFMRAELPYTPQIEHRGEVIANPESYTRICGTFVAEGGEKYLTLGNFREDDETNFEYDWGKIYPHLNIMFVDDVRVESFDLIPDTIILCVGESIDLEVSFKGEELKWNNGVEGGLININESGEYIVSANLGRCAVNDTVKVFVMEEINTTTQYSYSICQDEEIMLTPNVPGNYLWNDGSSLLEMNISDDGTYSVQITNICGEFFEEHNVVSKMCKCNFFVPDAFSPNKDGVNDFFQINYYCEETKIESMQIKIFDRCGGLVFTSSNIESKWDGTKNGIASGAGEYVYMIDINYSGPLENETKSIKLNGSVLIIE